MKLASAAARSSTISEQASKKRTSSGKPTGSYAISSIDNSIDNFPSLEELAFYLKTAEEIAAIGGELCRHYFGRDIEVERKADSSSVTIADREAELAMRRHIAQQFNDHQIIGEEAGSSGNPNSHWQWVLDPIDGTISFIHGIPLYTVLVALLYRGEPVLGVIYAPQTGEVVAAGRGLGCRYNGDPCSVSKVDDIGKARLILSEPTNFIKLFPQPAAELLRAVDFSRSWGDGYGYLMLATGRADIMIDPVLSFWDIASLMPIVLEAGGEFTDIAGHHQMGSSALASNGPLHESALACLGVKWQKNSKK